ncbi:hypothetical protein [Paraburkholderia sp. 22B1P]|uniref:hypothetical protein n=1 Tax=Paraburkholderia sp. 22B1P TaxID=3080498 RepID=UPI0030D25103
MQKPHGNMDEMLIPKGKDPPEQDPCVPKQDRVDPGSPPVEEDEQRGLNDRTYGN